MACKSKIALEKRYAYQREYRRQWRERNPNFDHAKHYEKYRSKQQKYRYETKLIVYEAYGNECVCCGENYYEFLTLDHVNHDGVIWRKSIGRTTHSLCLWAIDNGFPKSLQLLCWNCNAAKEFHGGCPHQKEKWSALAG